MSTTSKIIIAGFALAMTGATLQWGPSAGVFAAGVMLFISPALDRK